MKIRKHRLYKASNWYYANSDKVKLNNIKKTYGLDEKVYKKIVEDTDGYFEICKYLTEKFSIDHDHSTGLVRGLIYSSYNSGIGMLKGNVNILKSAIQYLKKYQDDTEINDDYNAYFYGARKGVLPDINCLVN